MRKNWWKALGVVILIYTYTAGLLIPLKPGILSVNPSNLNSGEEVTLTVIGYNTFFTKTESELRAWIKLDNEHAISATKIELVNDTKAHVSFNIPSNLPTEDKVTDASLVIDNDQDGAMVLPSKLTIKKTIDVNPNAEGWTNAPITDLNRKTGFSFPFRGILYETIRNTYFHVCLWFAMIILLITSVVHSFKYLRNFRMEDDQKSMSFTMVGTLFGMLGIITGSIWAKDTWGTYWTWEEVKLNMTAIALLIYLAYFVLRSSFDDYEKRARIAAVYNIFAFAALIPLIFVIPRLTDSLHPGNGGNPAMGGEDLDNTMRMVFYPAIIGWTLVGVWISQIVFRIQRLKEKIMEF